MLPSHRRNPPSETAADDNAADDGIKIDTLVNRRRANERRRRSSLARHTATRRDALSVGGAAKIRGAQERKRENSGAERFTELTQRHHHHHLPLLTSEKSSGPITRRARAARLSPRFPLIFHHHGVSLFGSARSRRSRGLTDTLPWTSFPAEEEKKEEMLAVRATIAGRSFAGYFAAVCIVSLTSSFTQVEGKRGHVLVIIA